MRGGYRKRVRLARQIEYQGARRGWKKKIGDAGKRILHREHGEHRGRREEEERFLTAQADRITGSDAERKSIRLLRSK